jgi:ceramide glucosyltransferase
LCSAELFFCPANLFPVRLSWLVFLPALAYQVLACFAGLRHGLHRNRARASTFQPPVSILKPVRGLDPNTYSAFVSQATQRYPEFEILFGVNNDADPAIEEIRRLQAAFPEVPIFLIRSATPAANAKVGVLIDLGRHARHPIWIVNDSDIQVRADYLSAVVAPLEDPSIGVVTCPYRASAHSAATAWEALGIASDFIPSALVAQLVGVREFGFGSTLVFRASDLAAAGGFEALSDYIADDYQLARRITQSGKRALLSAYTVETALGEGTWPGVWAHQLRWARTIRASKGAGHLGLPITHAGLWAAIALAFGAIYPAAALIVCRIATALISAIFVLESPLATKLFWLAPVWDLYAFAVWLASYMGREVRWRNRILTIDAQGKIRTR